MTTVHESTDTTVSPPRQGMTFETLALVGFILGLCSIAIAVFAVGLASRAVDEAERGTNSSAAMTTTAPTDASTSLDVSLTEFAIKPTDLKVPSGATLKVTNDGSIVHNLSVDGVATPMLDAAGHADLALSALPPGTYTMKCDVPGHDAAGMKGSLTIE